MIGAKLTQEERNANFLKAVRPVQNTQYTNYGAGLEKSDADHVEFNHKDRLKTINYLRYQQKTNPIVQTILTHFINDIGTPKFKVALDDTELADLIERNIEGFNRSMYMGESFKTFDQVLKMEVALCGEAFIALTESGHAEIIPAEFIGSDEKEKKRGEIDGIVKKKGFVTGYRVGKRLENGEISFKKEDSTVYAAEFIIHVNPFKARAESVRGYPPLATCAEDIENLSKLIRYKVVSVRVQSQTALLITKDGVSPEVWAKAISDSGVEPAAVIGTILNQAGSNLGTELTQEGLNVRYLSPGEDVKTLQPQVGTDFAEFLYEMINRICGVFNMVTPNVIGYIKANYVAVSANTMAYNRVIQSLRDHLKETLFDKLMPFLLMKNEITEVQVDDFYTVYAPLPDVNLDKTAQVDRENIASGVDTKTNVAMRNGRYMSEIIKEEIAEKVIRLKEIKKALAENPELTLEDFKAAV